MKLFGSKLSLRILCLCYGGVKLDNYLNITDEIFWRAGSSFSHNGKYPTQKEIEKHFNFLVVSCGDGKITIQFKHAADASMFALRWI